MRALRRLPAMIAASLLALIAGQANAAEVEVAKQAEAAPNPWRGTAVSYDHTFSSVSLSKGAIPTYDPYYTHTLALQPEWHFGDEFFLRGGWSVEQELTTGNDLESAHEVVVSDVNLDLNHTGWKEPSSGVNVSGGVRVVLPASKKSRFEQLYFSFGPGVALTRKFDVMNGLVLGYQGRLGFNIREYATAQYEGPRVRCDPGEDCDQYEETGNGKKTGRTTPQYTVGHGPMVTLVATDKLSFVSSYALSHARMFDQGEVRADFLPKGTILTGESDDVLEGENVGTRWRHVEWFSLAAAYQLTDAVGVVGAVNTIAPQQRPNSEDNTRFFNRYTAFSMSLNVDVDAVTRHF